MTVKSTNYPDVETINSRQNMRFNTLNISLKPLIHHQHTTGTEVASTIQRLFNEKEGYHPISFSILTTFLKQNAEDWKIVPILISSWKAYKFYETYNKLDQETRVRNGINLRQHYPLPLLINYPLLNEIVEERYLYAQEEKIERYFLKTISNAIDTFKIVTIFIPRPLMANSIFDAASYALWLKLYAKTINPSHVLHPETRTWKDKAYQVFQVGLSTLGLVGSIFSVACSLEYVDENNIYYETITKTVILGLTIDIGHSLLQLSNYINPLRE